MKTIHRIATAIGASALLLTLSACGSSEPPAPTISAPSCPDQENVTVITGASVATSYSLLESVARTSSCVKYIPPQDVQKQLTQQIASEMSTAERIIVAEEVAGTPRGLQYYDVGPQSDGRYVFVFILK